MEYLKDLFNKKGWISIIESTIIALLGLVLICRPEGTVKVISTVLGIICIVAGIYKILEYIASDEDKRNDLYNYGWVYGLISCIIGIVIIKHGTEIGALFRTTIGVWIIYSALLRFSSSMKLKNVNLNAWRYSIIFAIVMLLCGVFITLNSGAVVATIGAMMMVSSIVDIIEDLIIMKNVNDVF